MKFLLYKHSTCLPKPGYIFVFLIVFVLILIIYIVDILDVSFLLLFVFVINLLVNFLNFIYFLKSEMRKERATSTIKKKKGGLGV